MKRPLFATNSFYHIYNRGVDKRTIFEDDHDRFRFIHSLYEFNDQELADHIYYKKRAITSGLSEVKPPKIVRRPLIKIISYCLMPNHYHILVQQRMDNGISRFMQKLGTGFTMYFNQKYERTGSLFQGTFKAIIVDNDIYLKYLPHYIHLNPFDVVFQREKSNYSAFLSSYRWSSYLDYIGIKNFPSVISRNLVRELYQKPDEYIQSLDDWIKTRHSLDTNDVYIDSEL